MNVKFSNSKQEIMNTAELKNKKGQYYTVVAHCNAEAIALVPKLLRENEELKVQNEKFDDLLYRISKSVCLDQKVSGRCICFSCEAKAALGEK